MAKISAGDCVSKGIDAFKNNVGTGVLTALIFLGVTFVASAVISFGTTMVGGMLGGGLVVTIGLQLVGTLINTAITTFLAMGFFKICLNILEGKPAEVGQLFGQGHRFVQGLIASILSGILIIVAMLPAVGIAALVGAVVGSPAIVLLVIVVGMFPPMIYVALRTAFVLWLVVDAELDAISALKGSFSITKGETLGLFLLGLISFLIMIAGFLALCVGILAAVPVIYLALGAAYLAIRPQQPEAGADAAGAELDPV